MVMVVGTLPNARRRQHEVAINVQDEGGDQGIFEDRLMQEIVVQNEHANQR